MTRLNENFRIPSWQLHKYYPLLLLCWYWSILYSACLRSRTDSLRSRHYVILLKWVTSFLRRALIIHPSDAVAALTQWLSWSFKSLKSLKKERKKKEKKKKKKKKNEKRKGKEEE